VFFAVKSAITAKHAKTKPAKQQRKTYNPKPEPSNSKHSSFRIQTGNQKPETGNFLFYLRSNNWKLETFFSYL